jgi:hypothetical protein
VAAEHLHHEAHLTVPSAWPEAPRGGVATRSSGFAAARRGDGATPATVGSSEHVHEVEHDAAKAVVLAVGCKGARS